VTDQPAPSELDIRRLGLDCVGFVVSTWEEAHRSGTHLPWPAYKRLHVPIVRHLVNRKDVRMLGAYDGERIVGWIAWTPGRLPAIHFAYVRGHERQRGIFGRLLSAADVGGRWVYTHKGAAPQKAKRTSPTRDVTVLQALARRGIYGTYVSADEWLERNP
jgi:hypothetical protein